MGGGGRSRDRFAFSDGPKSVGGALSNLGVVPDQVSEAGVALEVDEKAPLKTPTLYSVHAWLKPWKVKVLFKNPKKVSFYYPPPVQLDNAMED